MVDVNSLVIDELKEQIRARGSQKAFADEIDLSPAYINDIIKGRRDLSDNVIEKLGFERITVFVKKNDVRIVESLIRAALGTNLSRIKKVLSGLQQGDKS